MPEYWYKVVGIPPNEEVAWLSPITASYILCATKNGKVFCWDVHRDASCGCVEWSSISALYTLPWKSPKRKVSGSVLALSVFFYDS